MSTSLGTSFKYRGGRTVSDISCRRVGEVKLASPSIAEAAPSSSRVLFRFRFFTSGCHGQLQSRPAMASRAFCFLREGSPWLCTWASLGRLLFALPCVGTATKWARMSVEAHVFIFFVRGPGTLAGRSSNVTSVPGAISPSCPHLVAVTVEFVAQDTPRPCRR